MKSFDQGKAILVLSALIAVLMTVVSYTGIYTIDFYEAESFNWQAQSLAQDMINLVLIVPVLILTAIFAYRKSHVAALLWAGTLLYIMYTFTIYCFDVHFNKVFLAYCLILGLSFYSLLWFIYTEVKSIAVLWTNKNAVMNITAVYLLMIAFVFYFLWLYEIAPAIISDTVPGSLTEIGLFTNPVQVIDLSVLLPGIVITAFLVLKRKSLGYLFSLIILTFFVLMEITIGWIAFAMQSKGIGSGLSVTVVMLVLALLSFVLLSWNTKNLKMK